jgi:hypothetical protein
MSAFAANSSFSAAIYFTKFLPRAAWPPTPSFSIASLPLENASAPGFLPRPSKNLQLLQCLSRLRNLSSPATISATPSRISSKPGNAGFIGATPDGRITTLGRNSSDFSGAIIAHVVDAEELVIWTDVDGIYTANPNESAEAKLLHELSYDEAHALAASGAKVLHAKVLPLAAETEMVVWVRNTFNPQARGTRIGPVQQEGLA